MCFPAKIFWPVWTNFDLHVHQFVSGYTRFRLPTSRQHLRKGCYRRSPVFGVTWWQIRPNCRLSCTWNIVLSVHYRPGTGRRPSDKEKHRPGVVRAQNGTHFSISLCFKYMYRQRPAHVLCMTLQVKTWLKSPGALAKHKLAGVLRCCRPTGVLCVTIKHK